MSTNMHVLSIFFCLVLLVNYTSAEPITVPFGGNAWPTIGGSIDVSGYTFTQVPAATILYAYASKAGDAVISLNLKGVNDSVSIQVQVGSQSKTVTQAASATPVVVSIGTLGLLVGYNQIKVSITGANAATTGVLTSLTLEGTFVLSNFVSTPADFEGGRTGFGVKLDFDLEKQGLYKIISAYSAVTVSAGNDIAGTKYIAIGFNTGNVGLKISADNQRSITFEVTSPFATTDINDIPPFAAQIANKIGFNVIQSVVGVASAFTLNYDWTTGINYQFYVKSDIDSGAYRQIYSAWFFDPRASQWIFIAEVSQTQFVIASHYYVSLEPTASSTGNRIREFSINKFLVRQFSQFQEPLLATFAAVNGAMSSSDRRDTFAGLSPSGNGFLLRSGGFFNETTATATTLTKSSAGTFSLTQSSFINPTKPYTLYFGSCAYARKEGSIVKDNGFSFEILPAGVVAYADITSPGKADLSITLLSHNNNIKIKIHIGKQNITVNVPSSLYQQTVFIGTFTFDLGYNQIHVNILTDGYNSDTQGTLTALNFNGKTSKFSLNNYGNDQTIFSIIRTGPNPIFYYKVKKTEKAIYAYSEAWLQNQIGGTVHVVPIQSSIAGITLDLYGNSSKQISMFLNNDISALKVNRQNPNAFLLAQDDGQWHLALNYSWTLNTNYKFLYKVLPDLATNTTNVTGWFKKSSDQSWTLIGEVCFLNTYTYLQSPVSEIHVMNPNHGNVEKTAFFRNFYVFDSNHSSEELTSAQFYENLFFTPPGGVGIRHDIFGGLSKDQTNFVLSTGGYSKKNTPYGMISKPPSKNSPPLINFATLP